jgi:glycosyltransferase involved in cell wall biosynthesis
MKIAHVGLGSLPPVFSPSGGAIQRRIAELAQAQAGSGHEVTVFSAGVQDRHETRGAVKVRYFALRSQPPLAHLEMQLRVIRYLHRRRASPFAVLHFHSQPEGAILARGLPGLKVLSYDNYFFRRGKRAGLFPVYRTALRRFDALLPCSAYCREASMAYWSLPPAKTHVLYNGVNLDQFRPDPAGAARELRALDRQPPIVLYLGRVCAQKGTDTLLESLSTVRDHTAKVNLLIAGPVGQFGTGGDGREEQTWRERMQAAGATYLGAVADDRLAGLLSLADVFVMPTRELEMFGMAAVEAQACGTPVVASDHGGLRETVPPAVGLRFTPGDPASLARALITLLDRDEHRAQYGRQALRHAERFSWDRVAADLDMIYRALARHPTSMT